MDKEMKVLIALVVAAVLFIGVLIYTTVSVNSRFCDRYFPDVPTFDCVMSRRYRYDGDK